METIPIACTLTAPAAAERVAEWREFFSTAVQRVDCGSRSATLTLHAGSDVLLVGTSLAEREKACCAFFEFSLDIDQSGTRLHIEVPAEAEPILASLLDLLPPELHPIVATDISGSTQSCGGVAGQPSVFPHSGEK